MNHIEKLASASYLIKKAGFKDILKVLGLMTGAGTMGGIAGHVSGQASGHRKGFAEGSLKSRQAVLQDLLAGIEPMLSETAQRGGKLRSQKAPFTR